MYNDSDIVYENILKITPYITEVICKSQHTKYNRNQSEDELMITESVRAMITESMCQLTSKVHVKLIAKQNVKWYNLYMQRSSFMVRLRNCNARATAATTYTKQYSK
jgi:hypothetical protein